MKPSTGLPTPATAWPLHLPIDDAQAGWLNQFLTNTDILNNVHPKHQQCGVSQDAPNVYSWGCPTTIYCHGVLPQGHDTVLTPDHSHYPKLGFRCPRVGWDSCENGSASPVVKATPYTWWFSMGLTPPRTPMFLTTEWSGTGQALFPSWPRGKVPASSHHGPCNNPQTTLPHV